MFCGMVLEKSNLTRSMVRNMALATVENSQAPQGCLCYPHARGQANEGTTRSLVIGMARERYKHGTSNRMVRENGCNQMCV